jgi:RimJ/RimL family protein N-acetyltransferase
MRLIPFSPEHFSILPPWFPDKPAVVQWGGPMLRYPLDEPQMQSMLDEGTSDPPRRLCWMAAQDDRWIGHVQLAFDWRNGNATLGRVAIAPSSRGQGLAAPMLRLVMRAAFDIPEIMRLELNVYTFNLPAIKTYNYLGFLHEGTRRSSARVGAERWDTSVMSILRAEYQVLYPA